MTLVIDVLITFLVVILILYLLDMLPINRRAKQTARVIVVILGVLSLLRYLTVF
jgi:nucleoside recognition membrane protein YjiH